MSSLVGVGALFYLALVSLFYLLAFAAVVAYRRVYGHRAPQSLTKRVILTAVLVPPVAAILPPMAGMVLRHLHGAAMAAPGAMDRVSPSLMHHSTACATVFDAAMLPGTGNTNRFSLPLLPEVATAGLIAVGMVFAARLVWATLRLETGLAPFLSAPSPRLAASLARVGHRLHLRPALTQRFFECPMPPSRSSVMGLARARCVLSASFVADAPPEELDAVVAHEAEHLRGGDVYAAFAIALLNGVFFFLRPLALLGGWWREAAELAADDTAVRGTNNDPLAVASAILRVTGAAAGRSSLPAPLLPFADDGAVSATKAR